MDVSKRIDDAIACPDAIYTIEAVGADADELQSEFQADCRCEGGSISIDGFEAVEAWGNGWHIRVLCREVS